jgi:hypothetical protein
MPILVMLALVVIATAAVERGVIASPFSKVRIDIDGDSVRLVKGALSSRATLLMSDIIRDANVKSGFVTVSNTGKVRFSHQVPARLHQQLRNVVGL